MAVIAQIIPKDPIPLTQAADGSYVSDNQEIKATFVQSNEVEFEANGYKISTYPGSLKYLDLSNGFEDVLYDANSAISVEVSRDFHALYRHFPDAEERFEVEAGKLKHYVTLNAEQRPPVDFLTNPLLAVSNVIEFDPGLRIRQTGMVMTGDFQTGADLEFIDQTDTVIFTIPAIEVWDQKQETTGGLFVISCLNPGQIEISMTVDNAWISDSTRVYPIVIDPTVVASNSYTISGAGARKMAKLTNGWIVTAAYNSSTVYLYVSKDNGNTWSQLSTIAGLYSGAFCLLSQGGTTISVLYGGGSSAYGIWCVTFDVTTVTNTDQSGTKKAVWNSTSTSSLSSIAAAVDGSAAIHAAIGFGSGAVYNLYYFKSTDGGNTWSAYQAVSPTTSAQLTDLTLVISSGQPVIGCTYFPGGGKKSVAAYYLQAGSWTGPSNIYGPASYNQAYPCFASESNGTIHAVWNGATNTVGPDGVLYSKSTDGGHTWTTPTVLQAPANATGSVYEYPTITIDPSKGDLYVFYDYYNSGQSPVWGNVYKIVFTAATSTWGAAVNLTNYTYSGGGLASSSQTLYALYDENSNDAIRYMYQDTKVGGIVYNFVSIDQPPNAPTNLSPTGGAAVTTVTPVLSGTFSDPDAGDTMSALQVQVYRSSDNALMWDCGKTPMTTTASNQNWSIVVPASANLQLGVQYYWKATTWDSSSAQGTWSANQVFITEAAPTVTITAPAAGQVLTASSIVAQLSYSQAANVAEASFQLQLLDANGNVLQDSGVINNTNNMYTFNNLQNNTTYQIVGYATTKDGAKGTSAKVSFSTSFTPPANPIVTASANPATASVTIGWSNPASAVAVAYNRLYKQTNGAWVLYQDQLTGTSYTDFLIGSGVATTYGVSAVSTSGAESTIVSITQSVTYTGDWLYNPNNGNQFQFLYSRPAYDMKTQEERKEYPTFGSKPMVRRGPLNARTGTMGALMVKVGASQTPIQQLQAFESDRQTYPTYYLKTAAGEVLKVDTYNYARKMPVEYLNTQAIGCQFDWTEVA